MIKDHSLIVDEIDKLIRTDRLWFDFHVFSSEMNTLIIAGSDDLTYYHQLEIIFEGVSFFKGSFDWHTDTSKPVFLLSEHEFELDKQSHFFVFKAEDHGDVIIYADKVSYNTDVVLYYEREDLKENQRIADFVKRKRP